MRKLTSLFLLVAWGLFTFSSVRAESPASITESGQGVVTDAYSLIAEVNAFRTSSGQPAFVVDSILMGIAQQHAEFMSVNGVSHTGYGGTRPFQRALNAGYPLAGDLSLGGFISENITAGNNKSVQEAVYGWSNSAPHTNTMVSPNLTEIGAGVALVGDYVYYVIVAARPTGSRQPQVVSTLAPGQVAPTLVVYAPPLASTAIPNTPEPDGSIYHTVQPGETLWLIAITYNVRVADIRQLNGMSETEAIYPNERLIIVKGTGLAATPEPASPGDEAESTPQVSATPTLRPLTVSGASQTPTLTASPQTAPEPFEASPRSDGPLVLGAILLAALVLTLVLARPGHS